MNVDENVLVTGWKEQYPLYALFCSNIISLAGSTLTSIAIPWFVLQTTGSVIKTGISAFFTMLPTIIAALLGGLLVDKVGYKRVSIISDIAAGIGIALIPLFYSTIGLSFPGLLILIFFATLLTGPGATARLLLVPELAKQAGMPLERANTITQGTTHVAILMGAPLVGILISLLGTSNLLWIDALTFAFSACVINAAVPTPPLRKVQHIQEQEPQTERSLPRKKNLVVEFQEGICFIFHDRVISAILFTLVVTNLLDVALVAVVLPAYVKQLFGDPLILGIINACFVGAALFGTALYGTFGTHLHRYFLLVLPLLFMSLRFWVLACMPRLIFIYVISAVVGLASSPLNPIIYTIAYERIPEDLRGRVVGAGLAIAALGMPLGVLFSGYVINSIGMRWALCAMGTCYLFAALSIVINPSLYKLKDVSHAV